MKCRICSIDISHKRFGSETCSSKCRKALSRSRAKALASFREESNEEVLKGLYSEAHKNIYSLTSWAAGASQNSVKAEKYLFSLIMFASEYLTPEHQEKLGNDLKDIARLRKK